MNWARIFLGKRNRIVSALGALWICVSFIAAAAQQTPPEPQAAPETSVQDQETKALNEQLNQLTAKITEISSQQSKVREFIEALRKYEINTIEKLQNPDANNQNRQELEKELQFIHTKIVEAKNLKDQIDRQVELIQEKIAELRDRFPDRN